MAAPANARIPAKLAALARSAARPTPLLGGSRCHSQRGAISVLASLGTVKPDIWSRGGYPKSSAMRAVSPDILARFGAITMHRERATSQYFKGLNGLSTGLFLIIVWRQCLWLDLVAIEYSYCSCVRELKASIINDTVLHPSEFAIKK